VTSLEYHCRHVKPRAGPMLWGVTLPRARTEAPGGAAGRWGVVLRPALTPAAGVVSVDYIRVPLSAGSARCEALAGARLPWGVDASPVVQMSCAPAFVKRSLARAISSELSV
jgi:hypothetical protein